MPSVAPLRVLLVEDSEEDALLLLRELRRGGYEPEPERVETPEAMRRALAGSGWDLVLFDHRLPRLDSSEALKLAREAGSRAPFIIVSGRIGEEAAVEAMRAGASDYVTKGDLTRLLAAVERGLKESDERRRAERELGRRDAILEAVRFAAERLLGEAVGWEESISAVLGRLGEATGVSRVYVFENYVREDGELRATCRHEWLASGVSAQINNPAQKDFRYRANGYGRWMEMLSRGEPVSGNTREFPENERPKLREQDILSVVVVPIFVGGDWWGVVGFDECEREREWSTAEVGALGAAAGTLGAAIRRRRLDEELRASEAELRAVFGAMNDVILVLDGEGRYLKVAPTNPSLLYRPSEELVGKTLHDTFPKEQADTFLASVRHALQTQQRVEIEYSLRIGEGEMWFVTTISPMLEDSVVAVARDITGRKGNEEALRKSEERYRAFIEQSTEGIWRLELELPIPTGIPEEEQIERFGDHSYVAECNDALARMYGYQRAEEIVGMREGDFLSHSAQENLESLRAFVRAGYRIVDAESRETERGGSPKHFLNNLVGVVEDGQLVRVWGTQRDITGRKRAEEALRESEERFRSAFESASIGMALVRLDGSWLEVNQPFSDLVGYSQREMAVMAFQDITHPDDLEEDLENMRRLVAGEIPAYQMEKRYIHKDGHVVWVLLSASLVRDAESEPLYGIGQIQDITQRKRAEEALRQSERLYRAVIEQATENIFLVDVGTRRIVESNPAFRAALGYSEEELAAMTIYDVVANDRQSVDENIRGVTERKDPSVGERKYRRKDGSLLHVEVSASVITRDGRETICGVAHDVTERARMQALLEERVAALSGIAADLVLDLPMEDTLNALARSVVRASTAVSCLIALIDGEADSIRLAGAYGVPEGYEAGMQAAYEKAGEQSPTREAFRTHRPVLFRDARRTVLANPEFSPIHRYYPQVPWDTIYVVPLLSRGGVLGTINFGYPPAQEPGEEEKVFLGAVADQAAVTVENARLFSEARGKAALEERQRLARELHDSVSQALYGIALSAKAARQELGDGPPEIVEPLDYVLHLSEAGMAEMRALIFELRPESLEEEGLVAALEKQATALEARHGIRTKTTLCGEPEVSLEAKEAVHRIAQEALHNVVKHARASSVEVKAECSPDRITLDVRDDGIGFDARGDFPGHLGLRSMRERASRLGGTLEVTSAPGEGTRVRARLPTRNV